jgi:hypothetical protein
MHKMRVCTTAAVAALLLLAVLGTADAGERTRKLSYQSNALPGHVNSLCAVCIGKAADWVCSIYKAVHMLGMTCRSMHAFLYLGLLGPACSPGYLLCFGSRGLVSNMTQGW